MALQYVCERGLSDLAYLLLQAGALTTVGDLVSSSVQQAATTRQFAYGCMNTILMHELDFLCAMGRHRAAGVQLSKHALDA